MDNEKLQINFAPGMEKAELILREGVAPEKLKQLAPVKTEILGTIGTVSEYLKKRVSVGQFEQRDCHILVDREHITIKLVINEADPYKRGVVVGSLQIHPKFKEFGINSSEEWTPSELGLFLKMNRVFFPDRNVNMSLVSTLMNYTAEINSKVERAVKECGSRIDSYAQIVNSNLPKSFVINIPLFKGMQPEVIEVETFAKVDGRDVKFVLMSPGAQMSLEDIRDKVIDEQISLIREIAPEIAIIEI